jgi:hypothetical protein
MKLAPYMLCLRLGACLALAACSAKLESPAPVIEPPSSDAMPPPVDPEIVCRDQISSRVTLHGTSFAPVPFDVPGEPKLALPSVVLARTHELDGSDVERPLRVVYSGDHDADPTNALDDDGELIEVDGEPLLRWASQQEMSFLVTQDLVLGARSEGTDDREHGTLPVGLWDVAVQNPGGQTAESLGSLAVVAAPRLDRLSPEVVCLEQGARTIVLSGQTFLRNEEERVQLAVAGVEERFRVDLSDCTEIAHEGLDAEVCETAAIGLAQDSIEPGYPALTLENPQTAACHSEELVELRVVAAPRVERVLEPLACIAQGARSFVIEGAGFLRLDETIEPTVTVGELEISIASMECEAMALPAGSRSVELCSSITFMLAGDDLAPGLYDVSVVNPDNPGQPDDSGEPPGCASTLSGGLLIAPPPVIDDVDHSYVCLADGAREVMIHGSNFLVVGGERPAVEVGGATLDAEAVAPADCDAEALAVGELTVSRCGTLVLTLAASDADVGSSDIAVSNPSPAGCSDEALDMLTVVERPTLASVASPLICNAQGDGTLVLTGSGFFELAGVAPAVTIGTVAASSVEATDESCEPIEDRSDARLCTELTVTVAEGSVAAGLHDVVVTNAEPAGCATEGVATLAVVGAPAITEVAPSPVCLAQGELTITITGAGFVRAGSEQPSVSFGAAPAATEASAVAVRDGSCEPIEGTADSAICTELTATLAMSALADGTVSRVTVTNPSVAACTSAEPIDLRVVPPPEITSIDTATVCTGGGSITITGTNLTGVTGRLVDPDTESIVEAISTVVDDTGTSAAITFGSGVDADTYRLEVSGAHGCGDVATQTVTASIGPVVFFMDPPVAYNGVALRGTLYASGVAAVPTSVFLTARGGGTDHLSLTSPAWPVAGSNNKIGATIPNGLAEGVYDVTLDFAGSCDAVLPGGVTIEADVTLALDTPAIDPQFGEQNTSIAVGLRAKRDADLDAGEVNFEPTPRAYLSSAALATAEPLRATQLDTEDHLTAVVPDALPAGVYDLVVVNPDGSVGFQAGAYEATAVAPPVIDSVTPTQLDNDIDRPITIAGGNFFNPATDIEVVLECLATGATATTTTGPLPIDNASTATSLVATAPSSTLSHGTVCVVRVTNTANDTFDELSAITITNKAAKLPVFQSGSSLNEARRAPAIAFGTATREARFLYAIGGDDGDVASAKSTVEAAPVGRFGVLGGWRTVATELPDGITQAHAVSGGRYIYLFGGLAGSVASAQVHRAAVLRPEDAPVTSNVEVRFFGGPIDSDPSTREGLAPGALTYVIAAVFDGSDTDNPGGESLGGEPLTLYVPDVPDGVEVELRWDAVLGANGATEADAYRIYRTTMPDSPVSSLTLLAEVAAPTHVFLDRNPASFLDAGKHPLAVGDLGAWRRLPMSLTTPRAAYGIALASDPTCSPYLYIVGGRTAVASESSTYEYATFDVATGALGAFTQAAGLSLSARREHALLIADGTSSALINPAIGTCQSYLYASSGFSGAAAFVTTLQEAPVQAGGALGAFTSALSSGGSPQQFAGHAAFFSSDGAYVMAGAAGTTTPPAATNVAQQAEMAIGSVPNFGNFSSASNALLQARYLPGFAREGAFFYLVGGADSSGAALRSTERNVR